VKIYGDYLLFGGTKGYLSLGVLSKTKSSAMLLNSSNTSGGGGGGNVSTAKRVVFTVPLIDKVLESSSQYANEQIRKSSITNATEAVVSQPLLPAASTSATSLPAVMSMNYPHSSSGDITAIGIASYSSVFAVADSNLLVSLWYIPRNPKLNNLSVRSSVSNPNGMKKFMKRLKVHVITVLNIRQCDYSNNNNNAESSSPNTSEKLSGGGGSSKKGSGTAEKRKSGSSRQFSHDGGNNNNLNKLEEKIVKLKFLVNDAYLLVCTNRRMLLLAIQYQQAASPVHHHHQSSQSVPHQAFEESFSRGTSMDFSASFQGSSAALTSAFQSPMPMAHLHQVRNVAGFSGWVELDRAVPRCYGIFDFYISDDNTNMEGQGQQQQRKIVQWRAAEIDDEDEGKTTTSMTASLLSSWSGKSSKNADGTPTKRPSTTTGSGGGGGGSSSFQSAAVAAASQSGGDSGILKKCTVSRLNWNAQMFQDVLMKLKPCPVYLPFDTINLEK
jgi:hypothetical protein